MPTRAFARRCFAALLAAGLAGCGPAAVMRTEPVTQPVIAHAAHPSRPLHVALALGGGAARGFAHIGVIKALEARGIVPDIVVGTSAGSVVGALYASGLSGLDLNRMALSLNESQLSDWAVPSRGILKGEALETFVNGALHQQPIEKLPRRFAATATDLHTGQLVVFDHGNTGEAVRASSSVPGVFQPVHIGAHDYVDGGLVSPVPVRSARQFGADLVIAVDISSQPEAGDPSTLLGEMLQTFAIMGHRISSFELQEADVVLRPALFRMAGTDFASRNLAILAGEQAVADAAGQIAEAIAKKRREIND